jgi:hypothetical protein
MNDEEAVLRLLVFWQQNKPLLQEWENKSAPLFRIAWDDGAPHIDVTTYPSKRSKEHICRKLAWPWGRQLTAREVRPDKGRRSSDAVLARCRIAAMAFRHFSATTVQKRQPYVSDD